MSDTTGEIAIRAELLHKLDEMETEARKARWWPVTPAEDQKIRSCLRLCDAVRTIVVWHQADTKGGCRSCCPDRGPLNEWADRVTSCPEINVLYAAFCGAQ